MRAPAARAAAVARVSADFTRRCAEAAPPPLPAADARCAPTQPCPPRRLPAPGSRFTSGAWHVYALSARLRRRLFLRAPQKHTLRSAPGEQLIGSRSKRVCTARCVAWHAHLCLALMGDWMRAGGSNSAGRKAPKGIHGSGFEGTVSSQQSVSTGSNVSSVRAHAARAAGGVRTPAACGHMPGACARMCPI